MNWPFKRRQTTDAPLGAPVEDDPAPAIPEEPYKEIAHSLLKQALHRAREFSPGEQFTVTIDDDDYAECRGSLDFREYMFTIVENHRKRRLAKSNKDLALTTIYQEELSFIVIDRTPSA